MDFSNISLEATTSVVATEKTTEELIKTYCSAIDNRLVVLVGIVGFMWLLEPKIRSILWKKVENKVMHEYIFHYYMDMYKWIGLGLLFMVGYALVITYG
jgi:hypothetical protein